jgi:membrane-associated phospholipid phosphatase
MTVVPATPPATNPFTRADLMLFRAARTRGHAPVAVRAVRAFSKTGEHAAVWLVLGTLSAILDKPRRAAWAKATVRVAGAYVLNTAVKLVVRRRRPQIDGLPPLIGTPTQLSFPSAHASSSFAAARGFGPLLADDGSANPYVYAAATAMAASRVYLGVHYPSDILAGALLGTLVGGATTS